MTNSFKEWFSELLRLAEEGDYSAAWISAQKLKDWRDYFDDGLSPREALDADELAGL
jgi:hypothetical protein